MILSSPWHTINRTYRLKSRVISLAFIPLKIFSQLLFQSHLTLSPASIFYRSPKVHALVKVAASVLTILVCLPDQLVFTFLIQYSYWFIAKSFYMYHLIFFIFPVRLPSATCDHSFYISLLVILTTHYFDVCWCICIPWIISSQNLKPWFSITESIVLRAELAT